MTTEHMTGRRETQWGSLGRGCWRSFVGGPSSKHDAYRSRHMHDECKGLTRPDSPCITVPVTWIQNTQMLSQHLPPLSAHVCPGAPCVKLSLVTWASSSKETLLWNKQILQLSRKLIAAPWKLQLSWKSSLPGMVTYNWHLLRPIYLIRHLHTHNTHMHTYDMGICVMLFKAEAVYILSWNHTVVTQYILVKWPNP